MHVQVVRIRHVYYMRGFKFGGVLTIRQTAKLKSPPNFPAIRYIKLFHSTALHGVHFRDYSIVCIFDRDWHMRGQKQQYCLTSSGYLIQHVSQVDTRAEHQPLA